MTMDWTYPSDAGPEGIYEMGRRLAAELGRVPDATSFMNDPREMLRTTRRVEAIATGGRLFVGFQEAAKLDLEAERYRRLVASGTRVVAYANERPTADVGGLDYRELRADHARLENNWFLVSDDPDPIAFVSWEISDPRIFGTGGAATSGKRFVGFVSDDADVVAALIEHLEAVRGIEQAGGTDEREAGPSPRALAILAGVDRARVAATGAPEGSLVVTVGRGDDTAALRLALAIARSEGRRLVVVDRSGEGLFGSPYSDLRGDDAYRPSPERLFDLTSARREGRASAATALEAADRLGVQAGGWFPTRSGADGLAVAIGRFDGALVVVPPDIRQPSIGERVRGMTMDSLESLGVPIIVAD